MENALLTPKGLIRLRLLALSLARKYGYRECPEELAKDLEQAALLDYFQHKNNEYAWSRAYYAMVEEASRWNWQCKRGRGKNRELLCKVEMKELRAGIDTRTPEFWVLLKESLVKPARKPQKQYPEAIKRWVENNRERRR